MRVQDVIRVQAGNRLGCDEGQAEHQAWVMIKVKTRMMARNRFQDTVSIGMLVQTGIQVSG